MYRRVCPFGAALLTACVVLTGCGGITNKGGDTTCGEYLKMTSDGQNAVIKKYYSDKGQDPSNGEIMLARGSALLYCNTVGGDSSPIKNIEG